MASSKGSRCMGAQRLSKQLPLLAVAAFVLLAAQAAYAQGPAPAPAPNNFFYGFNPAPAPGPGAPAPGGGSGTPAPGGGSGTPAPGGGSGTPAPGGGSGTPAPGGGSGTPAPGGGSGTPAPGGGSGTPSPGGGSGTPSPTSPPSPGTPGGPAITPAPGTTINANVVVFDGYLDSCTIFFDANSNKTQDATEYSNVTRLGTFNYNSAVSQNKLGTAYLVPVLTNNTFNVTAAAIDTTVCSGTACRRRNAPCYDISTLQKQVVPLAAPTPKDVSKPLMINYLTSLLVYGNLTNAQLVRAFALNNTFDVTTYDFLAAAIANPLGPGLKFLIAEVQLGTLLTLAGNTLAAKPEAFVPVLEQVYNVTAQAIVASLAPAPSPAAAGRRHLAQAAAAATFNTADATTMLNILQASIAVVAAKLDPTLLNSISADVLSAIATAIANMNSVTSLSTSAVQTQQASLVASRDMATLVSQLVAGNITLAAFQTQTSIAALAQRAASVQLPGVLAPLSGTPSPTPAPAPKDDGLSGGAIAGIVIGCIAGVLLLAGAVYWWRLQVVRKQAAAQMAPAGTTAIAYAPPQPTAEA